MAESRGKRAHRPPRRLGWESDSDEVFMDSDSDLSNGSDSDSDSDGDSSDDNPTTDTQPSTQSTDYPTQSSQDTESDIDDDGWVENGTAPVLPPFTGEPGLLLTQQERDGLMEPVDYFLLFLQDDFFVSLSEETNRYAEQVMAHMALKEQSRMHDWRECSPEEMQAFVGLLLAMGLCDRPMYANYWSTHPVFLSSYWSSVMSRNRFLLLLKFFHLTDNNIPNQAAAAPRDKLEKIRPFITMLQERFSAVYSPKKDVCIDETMVAWTGRLSFKQYIPIKPDKYGIKLYQLCESDSGFTLGFKVYTGREGLQVDRNHTQHVVMDLMQPLLRKGHILWTDNYYTGIPLLEQLMDEGTRMAGTMRLNRVGVPRVVKEEKLQKGEYITRQRGEITILKWHDKKVVTFLSSAHEANFVESARHVDANGEAVLVPAVKVEYDHKMNGVDKNDQNVGQYAPKRKTMKWYKKLVFYFFSLVRFQAYTVYVKNTANAVSQLKFTEELVIGLVERAALPPARIGRPRLNAPPQRLTARHFPDFIPPTAEKEKPSRRCIVCCRPAGHRLVKGESAPRRKETRYQCGPCNVPLCIVPCFQLYHTHTDYLAAYNRTHVEA